MNFIDFDELDEDELVRLCSKPGRNKKNTKKTYIDAWKSSGRQPHYTEALEFETVQDDLCFDFFIGEGLISNVGGILKQGKEACVYRCPRAGTHSGKDIAVKVYKNIEQRSFQAMSGYLQGRLAESGLNRRDCMHLLSTPEALQSFWVYSEFSVMQRLHKAGVPVPLPYVLNGAALAMEFVYADKDNVSAAPRLKECRLEKDHADSMKKDLLEAVSRMLDLQIVHGDLSAYNILVSDKKALIIDFPQAVDARFNKEARNLLERDILNICRFFPDRYLAPEEEAARLTSSLWDPVLH